MGYLVGGRGGATGLAISSRVAGSIFLCSVFSGRGS